MKDMQFTSGDIIPPIVHSHYSDVLLIKEESGSKTIGYYNEHEREELRGYYRTPNFDQRIEVEGYIIAPPNTLLKCGNCSNTILSKELVGSPYIPQLEGQAYPCCPKCDNCLQFEFGGFQDEEE